MAEVSLITVRIVPPEVDPDDGGADVNVEIRDTSLADIEHPVIAESRTSFPQPVPAYFDVEVDVPSARRTGSRYSVWVHCDRSGDGSIGTGDLITAQSFPVALDEEEPVVVTLTRV